MPTIERIQCKTDNCYLISENNNAILVDTGSAQGLEKVIEACSKYELKLIVLTHPHFDHAENAYVLSSKFNIPVAMSEKDIDIFDNYDAQPLKPLGIVGRIVLWLSLKPLRNTKVKRPENLFFVKEGESLSEYGIDAEIIELPGHTLGSIGVIAGDSVFVGDQLDNWIKPAIGHLYTDKESLKRSMEKLRALGDPMIYYGHGACTRLSKCRYKG